MWVLVGGDGGAGDDDTGMGGDESQFGICPDTVTFLLVRLLEKALTFPTGVPIFEPQSADYQTGLAEVMAQLPEEANGDSVVLDPVTVQRATVIATNQRTRCAPLEDQFWVAGRRRCRGALSRLYGPGYHSTV